MGIESVMTIRVTTAPTSVDDCIPNAQFTYGNHGKDYLPSWRRDYNTANKPTASEVGAYSKDETDARVNAANENANSRLEKNNNGADIPNKDEFVKNLGLVGTVDLAKNALQRSGGEVTGDIMISTDSEIGWRRNTDMAAIGFKNIGDGDTDSYMWFKTGDNGNEYFKWQHSLSGGGTSEWMSLKSDNLRIKGHQVYHEGYKPTAEAIQAEPRFNKTIDLTGLSTDRYYPVWWSFPSNNNGANPWLTIHRNYAEDRENKNPFGKETHLAGLLLQIEGGDVLWGGDAQYLNIKRISQTYRKTVKNIRRGMMCIARPIDGKFPLLYSLKSGDITDCRVFSGCYIRGGLTYHVTSNFSSIHYSREENEIEISRWSDGYELKQEIKWMVKSYAIDDPLLGKDYDDSVLPYAHDYAETINLAKNSVPKSAIVQESGNSAEQIMSQKAVTDALAKSVSIDLLYPVGIVLWFAQNKNPNNLFPGTTWKYIGENRTVRLAASNGSNVLSTGGNDTKQLTIKHIPKHSHYFSGNTNSTGGHNHNRGNMNITGYLPSVIAHGSDIFGGAFARNGQSKPGIEYTDRWANLTTFDASRTWTGNTSWNGEHAHNVSGNTSETGSGEGFDVINAYIMLMGWYRTN
ncbi:phage baseplate protein [Xenorhabdus budapestensis]